jgi:hypothetical protein
MMNYDSEWLNRIFATEVEKQEKQESEKKSKIRSCQQCRRQKRACVVDVLGGACRRCCARHQSMACSLNTNTISFDHHHDDAASVDVMDRACQQLFAMALNRSPPLQLFGVAARFCLRFDFHGELTIDSCNATARELIQCDAAGAPARDFLRCRRVLCVSFDLPKETRLIDGECRMLQLKMHDGWCRVHVFGSMSLSESPFDDKMWARAMYLSIVNVLGT